MKRVLFVFSVVSLAAVASAQTLSNYQFAVNSQSPNSWFKLDGTLSDSVSPGIVLSTYSSQVGGFASDVYRNPAKSYFFGGQSDFLLYSAGTYGTNLFSGGGATNTTSTAAGSISFVFRMLDSVSNTGARFLFSAGNTVSNGNALGLFLENTNVANGDTNSLKLRFGDATVTILQSSNIMPNAWYYFALTYLESRVPNKAIWYLGRWGGSLATGQTTNIAEAVAGEGADLAIGNNLGFNSSFWNPGSGRVDEFAVWHRELSAAEINDQFAKLPSLPPTNASYQQIVSSQAPAFYFKLDNSAADAVSGTFYLSTNGSSGAFVSDYLGNANAAYSFNGTNDTLYTTNDIVNGGGTAGNTLANGLGSVSFLFRMLNDTNNTGARYLMSQGGTSGTRNQLALFLESTNVANGDPNSLKLRLGNGPTTTLLQPANIITNAWYYFAIAYNETHNSNPGEVRWYLGPIGGTLANGVINIGDDAVIGDNGPLAIGNRVVSGVLQDNNSFRNPGSGVIDEFAIWNDELTTAEILAQFNALSVSSPPAPALKILLAGSDVVLSWPSSTSTAYALESATNLTSSLWSSAGPPPVVSGSDFVVTNGVSPGEKY